MNKIQIIQEELSEKLEKNRYNHTLGVMYTAAALAMKEKISIEEAMLAGLLHDCAKTMKVKEQYKKCELYGIELTETEQQNGALIHAKLGAYLASTVYEVKNNAIQDAIAHHTTGVPGMSTLEKIIYVADYIEPNRKLPKVDELRELAFNNLDAALYMQLELSIEHLEHENKVIDPMTKSTYEFYKERT
ncbi:MAG: bis(5'-nucleosyl)-tetraphosphatase (symmetrical) YqeK [Eubacteriales bacterium]